MRYISENPLLAWTENRIKKNKNLIMVINGPTGSSKTYDALTFAYECSKLFGTNFKISTNVDFDFVKFLKKTRLPENMKPGTPFVLEEVGAIGGGAAARDWQSKINKFFFSFMQTTRHKNQILIFTCPQFSNLDAGARKLVHIQLTTSGINFKKRIAYVKPYLLQINDRTEKIYFKYLRFKQDGKRIKLKMLGIKHPPMDLVEEYEKMKDKYSEELEKRILDDSKPKEIKPKTHFTNEKVNFYNENNLSSKQMANAEGVSLRTAQRWRKRQKTDTKPRENGQFYKKNGVLTTRQSIKPPF